MNTLTEKEYLSYLRRRDAARKACKRYYEKNADKIKENNYLKYHLKKEKEPRPRKKHKVFALKYLKYKFDNGKRRGDSLTIYVEDRRTEDDMRTVRLEIKQLESVEMKQGVYRLIKFIRFEVLENEYVVHVESKAGPSIAVNFALTKNEI